MTQTSFIQTQDSIKLVNLAKNSIVALVIQIAGIVLTYLLQLSLAKWMGKTEYGIYEYVLSWSLLLAIPTALGLPRAVVKFISEYRVKQELGLLRGLILGSWLLTVSVGLLISFIGAGIIFLLNKYHSFAYAPALLVGICLVPLQALVQLQQNMGRGAQNIILAYAPAKILWPILLIAGGFFLFNQQDAASISMIQMAIVTLLFTITFQIGLIWAKFKSETAYTEPIYAIRDWLKVALPLLFHNTFQNLLKQTDIIMLGLLVGAGAVGIYSAASKTAMWVSFVLQTINIVVAPVFAILHTQGDMQQLQKVVSNVTLWIFAPSIFIALCLMVFSQQLLAIFGAEFVAADLVLKILVIGQLVNACCGSVGNLITMTGHQNQALKVSSCCALINLILNAVTIHFFGTVGAAISTAFTVIVRNVWLSFLVVRILEINPVIFSFLPLQKNKVLNIRN